MKFHCQLKTLPVFFSVLIFLIITLIPSLNAQTCSGSIFCEKCCLAPNDGRTNTGACCVKADDPLNCTEDPCDKTNETACTQIPGATCDNGTVPQNCPVGTNPKNTCEIQNGYTCSICSGISCVSKTYTVPCTNSCDIFNPINCQNGCINASATTCGNGVSCTCAGCAGAPNCNPVETCQGQCCNKWTCIAANTQASADCGDWFGCAFNTSSYTGANGTFCPTGGNVPGQCLGIPPTVYGCTRGDCTANAFDNPGVGQFKGMYTGNATCDNKCNLTCTVAPIADLGSTNKSGTLTYYDNTNIPNCSTVRGLTIPSADPNKVNLANNPAKFRLICTTEENDPTQVKHRIYITPTASIPNVNITGLTQNLVPTIVNNELTTTSDFTVRFPDGLDEQDITLKFEIQEYITDLGGADFNNGNNPRVVNVSHIQTVDTKPPVLSRTSEFKLPNGNCINGVDCTNLDPNKIIGSGKLQIDYKATDEAGLLSRKIFAGSTNWTNDTQTQFFNEMQNGKALGQNVAQSFDYYHKVGGNNFPLQSESIKINPDGTSNKDFVNLVQDLPQNNALDTLSVVYNLKTPNEPITKPFSFNWGIGGTGANDLNSAWQATDNFCNRISGAQQSSLKVGNPWMSVVGGNTFIQGQTDMTVPQDIIKSADTTGDLKIADSGFVSSYVNRTEDDTFTDTTTQSKYGLTFTNINGESLLHPYKISHGRNTSMYDYYKNIIGTVNRYDEVSEVYCKESDKQNYYKTSEDNIVADSFAGLESHFITDLSCSKPAQVLEIDGNLTLKNNLADITFDRSTIIFVSGNLIIDASLVSLNNASILFIVKGDVNIFGGKYSSVGIGILPNQKPGYDQVDASFIVDGVFLTIPDDGEQHTYFGNNYPGANLFPLPANSQVWDGLEINGQVLLTGLCPNDISGGPSYDETGELVSNISRTDGNDNCVSKFGRDLILVQNFLYPAEKINFNAQYLMDFRNLLRSTPKFKIIETGYDPTK